MNCKNCKKEFKDQERPEALEIGICTECFHKPFPITSVCRADMLEDFTAEQIVSLDDSDVGRIASKMADAYCNNGFWIDLEIITESILESKK